MCLASALVMRPRQIQELGRVLEVDAEAELHISGNIGRRYTRDSAEICRQTEVQI